MAKGEVYYNGLIAGILEKVDRSKYLFTYANEYLANGSMPAISLSFPKNQQTYEGKELFPFFYGMLAEGINKDIQCRLLKIDEEDDFTRLIKTACEETIGAITVKELKAQS